MPAENTVPNWARRTIRRLRHQGYRAIYSADPEPHVICWLTDEATEPPEAAGLRAEHMAEKGSAKRYHLTLDPEVASGVGGVRPGSGPDTLFEAPMRRVNVMLRDSDVETLRRAGEGNISQGVRRLTERYELE